MFAFSSCSSSALSNSPWLVSVDWAFARLDVVTSLGGDSSGVVIFGLSEGGDDLDFWAGAGFFSDVAVGFDFEEPAFADVEALVFPLVVLAAAGFDESSSSFFFFDVSAAGIIHEAQAHSHTTASIARDGRRNTGRRVTMSGRQITREGRIRNGAKPYHSEVIREPSGVAKMRLPSRDSGARLIRAPWCPSRS
jgi:hypothetical protein